MTTTISRIGIVGYGNVGSHLSQLLSGKTKGNITVYNRSSISNQAPDRNITFTHDLANLENAEMIIIAVSDDAIEPVLQEIQDKVHGNPIVCHTAGSIAADIIAPYFSSFGVLYPLQTFSRGKELHDPHFPVFITGSSRETCDKIFQVAHHISPIVEEIEDQQRLALHIAAVFTCNYANALYSIGHRICEDQHLNFKYLHPLIEETAQKIQKLSPPEAQTGPAVRGDQNVIQKHLGFLKEYDPTFEAVYEQMARVLQQKL